MEKQRFTPKELFDVRNNIPIDRIIRHFLKIPLKHDEGIVRFQCPCCEGSNTAINYTTNLARCFGCCRNFNTIDFVMAARSISFIETVRTLRKWQGAHERPQAQAKRFDDRTSVPPMSISEILQRIAVGVGAKNER